MARFLILITQYRPPYLYLPILDIGRMGAAFEDSAPPKLPARHCPRLVLNRVRDCTIQEWYFTGDSTTAKTVASMSPTYATQGSRSPNIKL